jgi:hypothetical protein
MEATMKLRTGIALVVMLAAGVAVAAQDRHPVRGTKEGALIIQGLSDERVRVTVDVPGKKLLSVILRGVPGKMVLSWEGPDAHHVTLVKDVRAVKIQDEADGAGRRAARPTLRRRGSDGLPVNRRVGRIPMHRDEAHRSPYFQEPVPSQETQNFEIGALSHGRAGTSPKPQRAIAFASLAIRAGMRAIDQRIAARMSHDPFFDQGKTDDYRGKVIAVRMLIVVRRRN